jgi:multisubunit Na+/H+ antiporter MnhE subunit
MARRAAVTAAGVLLWWLLWWVLLFLLWIVLVSAVSPPEPAVGAAFALLGAVAAEAVRRAEHPRARPGRRIAAAAAVFPATLLRETGQLAAAVVRALRGRPDAGRVVTVRPAPGTDAALAAALLSASPGACVLDITGPGDSPEKARQTPGGDHDLTVHLLTARPPSPVERALGGGRLP